MRLIGRIVPIKDIQTFSRAMRLVCSRIPLAEGWVIGPEEENPEYAEECKNLVLQLGLQDKVKFLGFRRPEELLPQLGLLCDAQGWKAAQSAGIQRVDKFYTQGQMFQRYRDIYRQAIDR